MSKVLSFIFASAFVIVACNHSGASAIRPVDAARPPAELRSPEALSSAIAGTGVVTPAPIPSVGAFRPEACPSGMVEINGDYCPELKETCLEWMAPDDHFRCKRFAKSECRGVTVRQRYCIDGYEYPNKPGQVPMVMVLWGQAQELCREQGKRLCSAREWTFACQGPNWLPYPYGSERESNACRIDLGGKEPRWADAAAGGYGRTPSPLKGQACVNFSKPSGTYPACVSAFGVHDMTGNVDEWVSSDGSPNGASWLKGGWWGNLRNRCGSEATTTGHDKSYSGIQVGFRCCSDVTR